MASINSVTGSLSSTASLRGYGGLSSGLDRDSLIESLTYGTRTKIENQQAKKTKIEWEQTALRSIIDKTYNFTNAYSSYTSTTNLASSSFFARSSISTIGENSKYVSVTGTSSSSSQMTIMGVKQLASDARLSGATASTSSLTTGAIQFDSIVNVDQVDGKYVSVKVGSETYYASIDALDLSDENKSIDEALAEALKKAFDDTKVGEGTLSDHISATVSDGKVTFSKVGNNNVEITGGTALKTLGFSNDKYAFTTDVTSFAGENDHTAVDNSKTAGEYLGGKSLTFNYNGTSKSITIDSGADELGKLQADLQAKLDSAFGKGRIHVGQKDGALTFTTMNPTTNGVDASSNLSITDGSKALLGETGVLGIKAGTTNRVDLSKGITQAGLANAPAEGDPLLLKINGEEITIEATDTVQQIMDKINKSDANVKVSYQKDSDKFVISSNEKGAGGSLTLEGNVAEALFGDAIYEKDASGNVVTDNGNKVAATIKGQDAIIAVKYAGDTEATEIYRGSNSFTMDGLSVSVSGTFGYETTTTTNDDGTTVTEQVLMGDAEAVKFEASADIDKIMKGITDMINAYNEIVALVNSELKSKPDKDYKSPLTATQKEDMSDEDIEDYEKKAKQGLLYGDNDLRNLSMELRYVLAGSDIAKFAEIGITESSEYSDNGKLIIDEAKLRAALEADSEAVGELFAGKDNADGTTTAGLVDNMKSVMDKYCGTVGATKGLLVARAGSEHSPLSLLDNTMKTEMDEITDYIERLLDRLEAEEDRYISQFTSLETLISEMNSQSSYLSSISGY